MIANLGEVFKTVLKKYNLAAGDFPNIDEFKSVLKELDFTKFQALKPKLIDDIDTIMGVDFPRLMDALPSPPVSNDEGNDGDSMNNPLIYDAPVTNTDPFADDDEDDNCGDWDVQPFMAQYEAQFQSSQVNGVVSGTVAKNVLGAAGSGLPKAVMRSIWALADIDKDGSLDRHEFALAMFLIEKAKSGNETPTTLPLSMIPAHKR